MRAKNPIMAIINWQDGNPADTGRTVILSRSRQGAGFTYNFRRNSGEKRVNGI